MEEANDEKVEAGVIMKTARSKSICTTDMVMDKGEAKELSQITLVLSVLSVATTTTMQMTCQPSAITMVRLII